MADFQLLPSNAPLSLDPTEVMGAVAARQVYDDSARLAERRRRIAQVMDDQSLSQEEKSALVSEIQGASKPEAKQDDYYAKIDRGMAQAAEMQPAPQQSTPSMRGNDFGLGRIQRDIKGTTEGTVGKLDAMEQRYDGLMREQASLDDERVALAEQRSAEAAAMRERSAELKAAEAARKQEMVQRHWTEMQKSKQDLLDVSNAPIDPERYRKENMGRVVMASIGAGLAEGAGYIAGRGGGGGDSILQNLQQQINNDIEAQRQTKAGEMRAKETELDLLREKFGNDQMAENALAAQRWQQYENQLAAMADQYEDVELKQNLEQARLGAQEKRNQHLTQALQARHGMLIQGLGAEAQVAGARASTAAAQAKASGNSYALEGYVPSGKTTVTKEGFKKAQETKASSDAMDSTITDVIADVEKIGTEVFPTDAAIALKSKGVMLKLALKEQGALGALDKGSQEFLDDMIGGDLSGYRTGAVKARLEAIQSVSRGQTDAKMRAYGFVSQSSAGLEAVGGRYK